MLLGGVGCVRLAVAVRVVYGVRFGVWCLLGPVNLLFWLRGGGMLWWCGRVLVVLLLYWRIMF